MPENNGEKTLLRRSLKSPDKKSTLEEPKLEEPIVVQRTTPGRFSLDSRRKSHQTTIDLEELIKWTQTYLHLGIYAQEEAFDPRYAKYYSRWPKESLLINAEKHLKLPAEDLYFLKGLDRNVLLPVILFLESQKKAPTAESSQRFAKFILDNPNIIAFTTLLSNAHKQDLTATIIEKLNRSGKQLVGVNTYLDRLPQESAIQLIQNDEIFHQKFDNTVLHISKKTPPPVPPKKHLIPPRPSLTEVTQNSIVVQREIGRS